MHLIEAFAVVSLYAHTYTRTHTYTRKLAFWHVDYKGTRLNALTKSMWLTRMKIFTIGGQFVGPAFYSTLGLSFAAEQNVAGLVVVSLRLYVQYS
jgi:hypothetical protein